LRQAAQYYEKAFAVFDRSGIRRHRAYSLGNLANLHRHAARYERARTAYEEVDTELRAMGEAHAAAYTVGNLGDLARDFGQFNIARERYDAALHFALKAGDEELKAECYARLAHLHLLSGRHELMPRLLQKAQMAAKRADSREFSLYEKLLHIELDLTRDDIASAKSRLRQAEGIATEVGLVLYKLWTNALMARILLGENFARNAAKHITCATSKARQSGYVWWELRIAELGCRPGLSFSVRSRCSARCQALVNDIAAGIGDAKIRESFSQLPVVLKVGEHLASIAAEASH
jgi:tetratricopeptide (TPR) repeat protein